MTQITNLAPQTTPQMTAPAADGPEMIPALADVLLESLNALVAAGQVEAACELAGRAYAALRRHEPRVARRFDVFLHRQIRHLKW